MYTYSNDRKLVCFFSIKKIKSRIVWPYIFTVKKKKRVVSAEGCRIYPAVGVLNVSGFNLSNIFFSLTLSHVVLQFFVLYWPRIKPF